MKNFEDISREDVKNGAKIFGKGIFCVAKAIYEVGQESGKKEKEYVSDEEAAKTYNGFGKAIHAISTSDMGDYYKKEAIESIPADKPDAFYEGIASIATSDMGDYYKKEAINNLCKSNKLFE